MPTYRGGRHEHGQNFLIDTATIQRIVDLASSTSGPIVEIGPGGGALTIPLAGLDRPLTAVEIDRRAVGRLCRRLPSVHLVNADFLTWQLPERPHVIVGNLPYSLTTAVLRKLLHDPHWSAAILLMQWEVARRRAGVGGASMMTAQWWPWIDFELIARVPRHAFRPAPAVDGGLLMMRRRDEPLVAWSDRADYRQFVHGCFTGRGNGIAQIVERGLPARSWAGFARRLRRTGLRPSALPKDLSADQWASLFTLSATHGWRAHRGAPARRRGSRT
ncbi:23S ribosomal RNA methyltransferase Erm [Acidipropionibacterium acidipropionici]|uniref:23S ribosomal RNA methyltransferase Erm n=1 Tax=Acidipropionibacterium acidipropionici TaxID=1748 RepID=UPI0003FF2448|nr:23S ribosomal RNA methyltransferase Erm [Acidipropionibacterium acidipropionici]ALN14916.1 23S rRNA methyltransferase [Acidipropionibacterium acidipropionici]APZ09335.1 23S ribosomal RNA methyltransferase Erm [Acidipropionibacterium acidipropionici]